MKSFKDFGFWFLFFSSIYFLICLIHLSWYITNPEGIWSFFTFFDVLSITILIIVCVALAVFGVFLFFDQIVKLIKGKLSVTKFFIGIGTAAVFVFILFFNSFFSTGISYLFNSKMAEKYSYLDVSEDLVETGELNKAMQYAKKAYFKEERKEPYSIFFLTKLWTLSDYNKRNQILSRYEATINYAYCQSHIDGNSEYAERLYTKALSLLEDNIFSKEEKKERAFYANLSLCNINYEQKQFAVAEYFF